MKSNDFARWKTKILMIGGIVIFVLGLFVLGMHYLPAQDYSISKSAKAIIQPTIQSQQNVIKEISALYQSGTYTFDNPLVLQNPYGTAPLTALLIFDTPEPIQISIHIPGKTPQASVDYPFEGFSEHHEIPVYGLYADENNQVTLSGKNQAGELTQTEVDLQTEPIPVYINPIQIIKSDPELYNPGMNFTFLPYKEIFDVNGDIRWYSTQVTAQAYTSLKNGHYLFCFPLTNDIGNVVMEEDLLGKIYTIYDIPNGVQHDLAELPDGNILVTTQNPNSDIVYNVINEIDRESGKVIQNFDLKNYLDQYRPIELWQPPTDWFHLNSIAYDSNDSSIVISGRTQSAVIKLSYPSMKIQWILGTHDNWPAQYQPYLLTPVGDNFEWPWSQHDASILSEETINGDKIINILLFDNGLYRSFDIQTALSAEDSYSRIVLYQVDETKMTVKQVWEYGKERGNELFSISRGSAYLLGNGDFLGTWAEILKDENGQPTSDPSAAKSTYSEMIEVNPTDNQVVFEARISIPTYRTFRANLYDGFSEENSELSIKLNNTTNMNAEKQIITSLQPVKKALNNLESQIKMFIKHNLQSTGIWDRIK